MAEGQDHHRHAAFPPPPLDPDPEDVPSPGLHPLQELGMKLALAGMSNMTAASVTNPMDLVKVRQQLQQTQTVGGAVVRSSSWYSILGSMFRNEGPLSIYKGWSASMLREATYSGIRMGTYDLSKETVLDILPWNPDKDSFGIKLSAGLCSGMIGAAIANPADLIKVRMQRFGATGTLRSHVKSIYEAEGFAGYYRAVFPTMIRAGVLTASQLGVYDHAKHTLMDDFPNVFKEGFSTHLASSALAGLVASATSNPIDVVKVRIMSDTTHQYKGTLHCVFSLLKNEGPLAFYKGFLMCFLRLWPHSVVSLLVFEQLRKRTGLDPI